MQTRHIFNAPAILISPPDCFLNFCLQVRQWRSWFRRPVTLLTTTVFLQPFSLKILLLTFLRDSVFFAFRITVFAFLPTYYFFKFLFFCKDVIFLFLQRNSYTQFLVKRMLCEKLVIYNLCLRHIVSQWLLCARLLQDVRLLDFLI